MNHTSAPASSPASDELFELSSPQPLSARAREARDAMLHPLRARVSARRTRRLALRVGASCVLVIATVIGFRIVTATGPQTLPVPEVVSLPPPPPVEAPSVRTRPEPGFSVTVLRNDPSITSRYSLSPAPVTSIERMNDDQLLAALEAAGSPGLIKIDGRVMLSRDLEKPKPESVRPQSSLPADSSRG